MAIMKKNEVSKDNLSDVNGGYIERHRWSGDNKIIDDKTGKILDTKYHINDAINRAKDLGVSTANIDEDETKRLQNSYNSGFEDGKNLAKEFMRGK